MKKDEQTSIQEIRDITQKFVQERDWESYHSPRALAEAISIEAAELLENFLFQKDPNIHPDKLEAITDEMADIYIYLMSLCNSLQLPSFAECIYEKMEKNRKKYPINKFHGNLYKKQ